MTSTQQTFDEPALAEYVPRHAWREAAVDDSIDPIPGGADPADFVSIAPAHPAHKVRWRGRKSA